MDLETCCYINTSFIFLEPFNFIVKKNSTDKCYYLKYFLISFPCFSDHFQNYQGLRKEQYWETSEIYILFNNDLWLLYLSNKYLGMWPLLSYILFAIILLKQLILHS